MFVKKIIIITGQTATGKTEAAVKIAEKYNGEIISIDSRQAYTHFDITTGKDFDSVSKNPCVYFKNKIPIWLYDLYEPSEQINVIEYLKHVYSAMKDIEKRGKLPILVGGSIFYIKTFLYGLENAGIETNENLREKLNTLSTQELQEKLEKINKEKYTHMNHSDQQNPRRLIRAIEIEDAKKHQDVTKFEGILENKNYKVCIVTFLTDSSILRERIEKRVNDRIKNNAIQEVKNALKKYSGNEVGFNTLGVKQIKKYIKKETDLETAKTTWIKEEIDYGRRQKTFLHKIPSTIVFTLPDDQLIEKMNTFIYNWLQDANTKN